MSPHNRLYLCVSCQQQSSIALDDGLLNINQHPLVQQAGSAKDKGHQRGRQGQRAASRPAVLYLEPSVSVSEMNVGVAMSGLFKSLRM